ncbi:hypothetical protein GA0070564_1011256 [Micromonospora mirobrigensis]|uniref:ABC-2 type transport system permease protein n=2 Tax=Micromonospora mirobrigensis TaxID=262898 RepID=A0A1C4VK45_9ACTN|nr:hypothetical protein GA0070564_1011256 [Micromonospora mirobrigensis]
MLLTGRLARSVPWWPLAAATALAVLSQLPALVVEPTPGLALPGLRLAAATLGAAVCFALPDPMAATVPAPSPRWIRQWLRTTLTLVPASAVWALLYLMVVTVDGRLVTGPRSYLFVQAAVCGLLPQSVAAVAARYRNDVGAALVGPLAQGVALGGTLFLAGSASPWSVPVAPEWSGVALAWPAALMLLATVLLLANREVVRS